MTEETLSFTAEEIASLRLPFTYCPRCRTEMVDRLIFDRMRRFCPECRFIQFIDPKVGAAVLAVTDDGRVVLVKRKMVPAQGSWCLPGGFMELGETPQQTAIRECKEETGLDVEITGLIDAYYYEDFRGSGVLIMYKGRVLGGQIQAGDDAGKVGFFGPDQLPEHIMFESNISALTAWQNGEI